MKYIKLILKAILFYITVFSVVLFLGGIDNIIEEGFNTLFIWLSFILIEISACILFLNKEELKIITLSKWLPFKDSDEYQIYSLSDIRF